MQIENIDIATCQYIIGKGRVVFLQQPPEADSLRDLCKLMVSMK